MNDAEVIRSAMRRYDELRAEQMTDAALAANVRTYPEHGANAAWRAVCVAELARRAAM